MPDPIPPTDLDLFRLGVFVTLNEGHLPDVPQRVLATYRRLAASGLVTLDEQLREDGGCNCTDECDCPAPQRWVELSARVTPNGQAVVDAMVAAARKQLGVRQST